MKKNQSGHGNKLASKLQQNMGLVCASLSIFVLFAVTGCGQRGSLYLPTAPEAAQRSSIVETLSAPAASESDKNSTSSTSSPMTPPAAK